MSFTSKQKMVQHNVTKNSLSLYGIRTSDMHCAPLKSYNVLKVWHQSLAW